MASRSSPRVGLSYQDSGEHLLHRVMNKPTSASSRSKPKEAQPRLEDSTTAEPLSSSGNEGDSGRDGGPRDMRYKPSKKYGEKPFRAPRGSGQKTQGNNSRAGTSAASTQDSGVGMDNAKMDTTSDIGNDPFSEFVDRPHKRARTTTYTSKSIVSKKKGSTKNMFSAGLEIEKDKKSGTGKTTKEATQTPSGFKIRETPAEVAAMLGEALSSAKSKAGDASSTNSGATSIKSDYVMPKFKTRPLPEGINVDPIASPSKSSAGSGSSPLSEPLSSPLLDDMNFELEHAESSTYDIPARCPICHAPVEASFLEDWTRGVGHMKIRQQMLFCQAHKQETAKQEYAIRSYPDIDWEGLSDRLSQHRERLVKVVKDKEPSYFRTRLTDRAAEGRGRTLAATREQGELGALAVGYYGPRGRRVMEQWITANLADEISEVAGSDRLIGYKTVGGFIQEVLVPELATCLVTDDMDVNEERAREIMEESGEIGELVNQAKEERVSRKSVDDENDGKDEDGGEE